MDMGRQAVRGEIAVEYISRYRADWAFIGAGGISLKNQLSASSESEAETAIAFMKNAKKATSSAIKSNWKWIAIFRIYR